MPKIVLADVANLLGNPTSAANRINQNNTIIEDAIDNTLSRDGSSPNQMLSDIDMNNNDLLNVDTLDVRELRINDEIVGTEDMPLVILDEVIAIRDETLAALEQAEDLLESITVSNPVIQTMDGLSNRVELPITPLSPAGVFITLNGKLLDQDEYTLDGAFADLSFYPPAGTRVSARIMMTPSPTVDGSTAVFGSRAVAEASSIDPSVLEIRVDSVNLGILSYHRDSSGTALVTADGSTWSPSGVVYPDHWKENTTPGVTDMGSAINSALSFSSTVRLSPNTYATGQSISRDNSRLEGDGNTAASTSGRRTTLLGLSASIPIASPILRLGRSSTATGLTIRYDTLTGSEGALQRIGLDARGDTFALQRGSRIDNVLVFNCGTCIVDNGFSVTYGTLEIGSHSYKAIDNLSGGTGSVWENVYINGGDVYTPYRGIDIASRESGGSWGQINIEHQVYTDAVFNCDGATGLNIDTLHLEGIDLSVINKAYCRSSRSSINIGTLSVINTRMSQDGVKIFELGEANYAESGTGAFSNLNRIKIGTLHLQGLANPNAGLYPSYPAGRRGLDKVVGYEVFSRPSSFTDKRYTIEVGSYEWQAFAGTSALDSKYYLYASTRYSNKNRNIEIARFEARGSENFPRDNWLKNSAFDTWVSTSASASSATPVESATGWFIRSTTGTVTLTRQPEVIGRDNSFFSRFSNVGTSGTFQYFYHDVADVQQLAGQTVVLSFEAKASVAGRRLDQITASLTNTGGTPASQFVQVITGSDTRLDMETDWQYYEMTVQMPTITVLGTAPTIRLNFVINDAAASRESQIDLRNIKLELASKASSFSRRTRP